MFKTIIIMVSLVFNLYAGSDLIGFIDTINSRHISKHVNFDYEEFYDVCKFYDIARINNDNTKEIQYCLEDLGRGFYIFVVHTPLYSFITCLNGYKYKNYLRIRCIDNMSRNWLFYDIELQLNIQTGKIDYDRYLIYL